MRSLAFKEVLKVLEVGGVMFGSELWESSLITELTGLMEIWKYRR